jgi:alkaline phosphatase
MEWHSTDHTNSLVPFYAKGDGSRIFKTFADEFDPVRGRYLDNTEMTAGIQWAMDPVARPRRSYR